MKAFWLIVWIFSAVLIQAQENVIKFGEDPETKDKYYLGFSLLPGFDGLVRYYLVYETVSGKLTYKQITMDDFVYQSAGKIKSKANTKNVNYFELYQIPDPNVVQSLWKLRYREFPYKADSLMAGWSTNDTVPDMPSPAQLNILSEFGIKRISDFCYGENAYKLLKAISTVEWIENYKNSSFIKPD